MKKTGILGGTFNPIHMGHLLIAEHAREEFHLDQVLVMPSGISYLKKNLRIPDAQIRCEMAGLAISDNPYFVLSDLEAKRKGNTYTSETLLQLHAENPDTEYYYIIGADTLFSMEHWKDPAVIFAHCHILVAVRGDSPLSELSAKAEEYQQRFQAQIALMKTPNLEISSEMIRKRVREGRSIRYYVPESVASYISEYGLYLQSDERNQLL